MREASRREKVAVTLQRVRAHEAESHTHCEGGMQTGESPVQADRRERSMRDISGSCMLEEEESETHAARSHSEHCMQTEERHVAATRKREREREKHEEHSHSGAGAA